MDQEELKEVVEQKLKEKKPVHTDMVHLNGNILCVIDTETTGLDPQIHEIVQVCIIALNGDLQPSRVIPPFDIWIRPEKEEVIDWDAFRKTKIDFFKLKSEGINKWDAADLFERWADKLKLATNKRISPLAHNWPFDSQFIRAWLGDKTYEYYFDGRYRDTMVAALYENDKADRKNERVPFPKVNLSYLASQLKVPHDRVHNALDDCLITAQVYRELVRGQMPVSGQYMS